MDEQPGADVYQAMVRGRLAVERYYLWTVQELGQSAWNELVVTDRLLEGAGPPVRFIPFSQNQEGGTPDRHGVGADWMWWWIAPSGVCFGILMQAKSLKRAGKGWTLELDYNRQRQIDDLLRTSDLLGVPAAYTLYCGPPEFRRGLACGSQHSDDLTDRCHRSGVCVLPALAADNLIQLSAFDTAGRAARDAYEWAVPLEDLVNPRSDPHRILDLNLMSANAELRAFLSQPQPPPLSIAKKIFSMISQLRQMRASATAPTIRPTSGELPLFGDLPADIRRAVPYYHHVLRGLRRQPPDYLADISAGGQPSALLREHLAGIVLINIA